MVALFGVLIAVSAYSLWRTYQGSEASLQYLAQEREHAALESSLLLDPERQHIVQEIRTLCGILEGEFLALRQGTRPPVQVVLAINPELASWLKEASPGGSCPEIRRSLASYCQNVEQIWAGGSWGARDEQAPSGPQLQKAIGSMLQILEQAQAQVGRQSTPYR